MADQPAPATSTPAAGTTPAAPAAPAATTTPGAPPAAPAAPAAAAPTSPPAGKKPQKPAKGKDRKHGFNTEQFDKNPAAMKRIRQLAARQAAELVQQKLGVSLDEAAELVKKAGAAIDGDGGAAPGPAPAPGSDREKEMLKRRVAKLAARVEKSKRKLVAARARGREEATELELRLDVLRAGINDEQADFALSQYRKAAQAAADPDKIPDPLPFFQGMRTTYPFIFAGAAAAPPVVTLNPTTAPPTSRQPGGETPTEKPAGEKPPQVDAFKMSPEEFRRHKASYGVR